MFLDGSPSDLKRQNSGAFGLRMGALWSRYAAPAAQPNGPGPHLCALGGACGAGVPVESGAYASAPDAVLRGVEVRRASRTGAWDGGSPRMDAMSGRRRAWLCRWGVHPDGGPRSPGYEVQFGGPHAVSDALNAATAPDGQDCAVYRRDELVTPAQFAQMHDCTVWLVSGSVTRGLRPAGCTNAWGVVLRECAGGATALILRDAATAPASTPAWCEDSGAQPLQVGAGLVMMRVLHTGGWSLRGPGEDTQAVRSASGEPPCGSATDGAAASDVECVTVRTGRMVGRRATRLTGWDWLHIWQEGPESAPAPTSILTCDAGLGPFAMDFGGDGDCLLRCLAAAVWGEGTRDAASRMRDVLLGARSERRGAPEAAASLDVGGAETVELFAAVFRATVHIFESGALASSWRGADAEGAWAISLLVHEGHWRLLMRERACESPKRAHDAVARPLMSSAVGESRVERVDTNRDARPSCDIEEGVRRGWLSRWVDHGRDGPRGAHREVHFTGPSAFSDALAACDSRDGDDCALARASGTRRADDFVRERQCTLWIVQRNGEVTCYRSTDAPHWWSVTIRVCADGDAALQLYGGLPPDEEDVWAAGEAASDARGLKRVRTYIEVPELTPSRLLSAVPGPGAATTAVLGVAAVGHEDAGPLISWDLRHLRRGRTQAWAGGPVPLRVCDELRASGYCWRHVWTETDAPPTLAGPGSGNHRERRRHVLHVLTPGGARYDASETATRQTATLEDCLALALHGETHAREARSPGADGTPVLSDGARRAAPGTTSLGRTVLDAFCARREALVHVYRGSLKSATYGRALTEPGRSLKLVWAAGTWGVLVDKMGCVELETPDKETPRLIHAPLADPRSAMRCASETRSQKVLKALHKHENRRALARARAWEPCPEGMPVVYETATEAMHTAVWEMGGLSDSAP